MNIGNVKKWMKKFKEGWKDGFDEKKSGCLSVVSDEVVEELSISSV